LGNKSGEKREKQIEKRIEKCQYQWCNFFVLCRNGKKKKPRYSAVTKPTPTSTTPNLKVWETKTSDQDIYFLVEKIPIG